MKWIFFLIFGVAQSATALDLTACGIETNKEILGKIIKHESGNNQFAIGINLGNGSSKSIFAPDEKTAVSWAKELLRRGYPSIDIGYGQINSRNLNKLGLSIEQAFNSCTNIKASHFIFNQNLTATGGDEVSALSMYNTGVANSQRGLKYAAAVLGSYTKVNDRLNGFKFNSPEKNPYQSQMMVEWKTAETWAAKNDWKSEF